MLIIRASFRELKPQIAAIFKIVDEEFEKVGCATTVVTSCWRAHGASSLHPYGYAADFDSPQMPEELQHHKWKRIRTAVEERVGEEYDALVHGPRAHLHAEWDPRKQHDDPVNV